MKTWAIVCCALVVATCGAFGPSREEVARDVIEVLAAGDREAFDALPKQGGRARDFERGRAAVAHVDVDALESVTELDSLVMVVRFTDGWSVRIPVVMSDGDARLVGRLAPRHSDRYDDAPSPDDPAAAAVLAAARAASRDDLAAFEALLADDAPADAYPTTRASVAARALDALEVVLLTGTDDALVADLVVDGDAGRRDFITALRRDTDGAWRLVSPIVD